MKHQIKIIIFLFLGFSQLSFAQFVELNNGNFAFNGSGEGGGRAIGLLANSNTTISSVGIFADLNTKNFTVDIFPSTDGNSPSGPSLASASANFTDNGTLEWNDISINLTFQAGNYYVINWRPTVDDFGNWANNLDYYSDGPPPINFVVGPFTLINGIEGFTANNPGNSLHSNIRVFTVPPPPDTVAIPTMSEWSFFLFGLIMFTIGIVALYNVKKRNSLA